jgi:tetratricopeptide (TPR) repeat protein
MIGTVPPPDVFCVNAAMGWLELGNPKEALSELQQISPMYASHPDVLEVKWHIWARMDRWDCSLPIAKTICEVAPDRPQGWLHQAVSLYRLKKTEEAWNLLLPMADKFPQSWVIPYDLACYACQLGKLEEGRAWLRKAFRLGEAEEVRSAALSDPDLEQLWPEIESSQISA